MLIDNVTITIKAGDGGNGAVAFIHYGPKGRGGPDGGNGGNGGSIYIQGDHNLLDLQQFQFKKRIEAESGISGKKKNLFGKNADDLTIFVPIGTKITDINRGSNWVILDEETRFLIARGGKGGRGNHEFKSATNQAPTYAEKGTPGQERTIKIELRLIADIGLIGLPNAGKSSLLAAITNATPKIADYPFTTLEPNIGMLSMHPIADIPGLIEGASSGKGLGIQFLKHIEKTKLLVHCVELTADDPLERYEAVRKEFENYKESLAQKKEIVLLTKTDLVDEQKIEDMKKLFEQMGKEVYTCSVIDEESVEKIKKILERLLKDS